MKINSNSVKINIEHFNSFNRERDTVLLFHGFSGSLEDWCDISTSLDSRFNYTGVDLIGHGKSDSPTDVEKYKPDSLVSQIHDILDHLLINKAIILGYSMGGRAALFYAATQPKKIKGLILESTIAGIENQKDRNERIKSDEKLAQYIEKHSIENFVELWMDKEIFNTQRRFPNHKLESIKRKKISNSKVGLVNSLRGFGTGVTPYLGDKLSALDFPVLLISGELDSKFTQINSEMVTQFPKTELKIIHNAGHNTHLEEPEKFIKTINNFLHKFLIIFLGLFLHFTTQNN